MTDARLDEAPIYSQGGTRGWQLWEGHVIKSVGKGLDFYGTYLTYTSRDGLLRAKAGYSWDGASIPERVQFIVRKTKRTREAALPHDMAYQAGREGCFSHVKGARKAIDKRLYADLRAAGVGWWKAQTMYAAVRVGGASSFRK